MLYWNTSLAILLRFTPQYVEKSLWNIVKKSLHTNYIKSYIYEHIQF